MGLWDTICLIKAWNIFLGNIIGFALCCVGSWAYLNGWGDCKDVTVTVTVTMYCYYIQLKSSGHCQRITLWLGYKLTQDEKMICALALMAHLEINVQHYILLC